MKPLITAREVADLLGVHVNTVKRMTALPFYRVGPSHRDRRYRPEDIEEYLNKRKEQR